MFRQSVRPQFDRTGKAWFSFNGASNLFCFRSLEFDFFREKFKSVQRNDLDRHCWGSNEGIILLGHSVENKIEGHCWSGQPGSDLEVTFVGILWSSRFWHNHKVL